MTRHPPWLAVALLEWLVPDEESDSIPGDLAEEFATENRSDVWYWRQVMQSSRYWARQTLRKSGLGILVGGAAMGTGILTITVSARAILPVFFQPRVRALEPLFTLALLCVGLLAAFACGYIAAKLSGPSRMGSLSLAVLILGITGFWLLRGYGHNAPIWFQAGLIALVLPAALFGRRFVIERYKSA